MPVRRFRNLDEAARDLWHDRDDPRLPSIIRSLWRRSAFFVGYPLHMPGVRRYRTIEDANADRDRLIQERIRRIQRERRTG